MYLYIIFSNRPLNANVLVYCTRFLICVRCCFLKTYTVALVTALCTMFKHIHKYYFIISLMQATLSFTLNPDFCIFIPFIVLSFLLKFSYSLRFFFITIFFFTLFFLVNQIIDTLQSN